MDFLGLIEVRAPYFALEGLTSARPGHVAATVRTEQPHGSELGPLPAAEAGRHLAILGSCACASLAPEEGKHYYLAQRAVLERVFDRDSRHASPEHRADAPLRVRSEALHRDRRSATAKCSIDDTNDRPLYRLDVSYQVLQERLFQRMFGAQRRELRATERSAQSRVDDASSFMHLRRNPYRHGLPLVTTTLDATRGVARLPEITSEMCAGHFPLYPAMPIALLMGGLSSLAGQVLRERLGDATRYLVSRAEVRADRLAFAGQPLSFEAVWSGSADGCEVFATYARLADGTVAGEMALTLEAHAEASALPDLRVAS